MIKNIRFLLIFIIAGIILFGAGMAVQKSLDGATYNRQRHQKPGTIASRFLNRVEQAYETKDIPLLVSLYHNPTAAVDVTRNENRFYSASKLEKELAKTFTGLTGIKCSFTNRQITAEGDMIMIRAMRSVTANEIPVTGKCLMLMILRKSAIHRNPWDYVVTDQILLKEEYIPKSPAGNQKQP
jgi:ketosteroid isomerase-like protein